MTNVTRRSLAAAAAVAGLGLATSAQADQPPDLLGKTEGGKVELPDLYAPSEARGTIPTPDQPARRLGVAVVGLGHLSLEQILPGFGSARHVRLAALVSGERDKARAIAAQYGVDERHLYDYAGFDRLRDDPDVDIVYVVLPNNMHLEYTERAAQAGKHVLCEKPMATSAADAERMIAACRDAKRLLMIAYRMQYDPYHREAIRMARSGENGAVRVIEAANGQNQADIPQWRHFRGQAGGGCLPDVGIYCLNAARYITGEEPVEITAQTYQPKDDPRFREVEAVCAFTLRFPSGAIASCNSSYNSHENRQMRVMMDAAWVDLDPAFSYENLRMRIGRKAGKAHAVEQRTYSDPNQFAREMDHFAECARAGRQPHTPGEEGLQDMRLMEAIYRAAEGGLVKLAAVEGKDTTRGPAPEDE